MKEPLDGECGKAMAPQQELLDKIKEEPDNAQVSISFKKKFFFYSFLPGEFRFLVRQFLTCMLKQTTQTFFPPLDE